MAPDYFDSFRVDNHTSPEVIFSVGHLGKSGLGLSFVMRGLHYSQIPETPWNGFMTLAETYNRFDENDQRASMFLVGQQFSDPLEACVGQECFATGDPLTDRLGNPLSFTPEVFGPDGSPITGNPIGVDENSGVRVLKWEIDPGRIAGDNGNEYAFFRLAEMYLIKAEAMNELGMTAGAVDLVNMVRERVFDPVQPIAATAQADVRQAILDERQFELFWEASRRQDMIRHDLFSNTWEFKSNTDPYRIIGPIPQVQIDANPNLMQNPGY